MADDAPLFRLTPGQPLADGVRAVARSQLLVAVRAVDEAGDDPLELHGAVHAVRKRGKMVRALVRLVRDDVPDTYRTVNTTVRDAARLVSASRDAGAAVETHDGLVDAIGGDAPGGWAELRTRLVARRDGPVLDTVRTRLPDVRARLAEVLERVDDWQLPDGDGTDVLRLGHERTYRRAVRRLADAAGDPDSHVWHQWRKRVKYHRHQVELLQAAWPAVMLHREGLLHELSDLLGEDHDLDELRTSLVDDHVVDVADLDLEGYLRSLEARREVLRERALPLGARLFVESPARHGDRVFAWWGLAVAESRTTTT